jgi:hypothetical protein
VPVPVPVPVPVRVYVYFSVFVSPPRCRSAASAALMSYFCGICLCRVPSDARVRLVDVTNAVRASQPHVWTGNVAVALAQALSVINPHHCAFISAT